MSWAWRAAPALPKAAPHSPPSAASELHVPALWLAAFQGFQDFNLLCSPAVRVRALQQQEVVELQGRSGWKPGEVNDLQELFGCLGSCLLPELLLSFHNLLLYWKFKGSLEGSRNPLTFFSILGGEVTVSLLFTKRSKFLLPSPPQCGADGEQRQKLECVGV